MDRIGLAFTWQVNRRETVFSQYLVADTLLSELNKCHHELTTRFAIMLAGDCSLAIFSAMELARKGQPINRLAYVPCD